MKQKIMAVMLEREAKKPLSGRVEIDDAYLGGMRSGGKRRRGERPGAALAKGELADGRQSRPQVDGKTPVVAAVETIDRGAIDPSAQQRASADARGAERRPRKLKLLPVKGFRKKEVEKLAREHLAPETTVVSDGLSCWAAVTAAGCDHFPMVTGSGRQAARWAPFLPAPSADGARSATGAAACRGGWVNTTLGNIKAAIVGTYRQLSPAHAARYPSSFAWRYNRRFQLDSMLLRLVHSAARTQPLPYRMLVAG
jgi:hypothetical protein